MRPSIVKVVPVDQYFSLTWRVGIHCNYNCMYCSSEWHDDHSQHHSLEKLQQAWIKIHAQTCHHKLPYKISFTGGELTSNKHFLPFVSWLRTNYKDQLFQLLVTTNGSATYKYYKSMFDYIDNITFSVHSEHINEQKFFDTVVRLKQTIPVDRFIHIAIMNEHWNLDRIPLYVKLCKENNISYSINEVDHSYQTRSIPIMKGKLNLEI
jgi:molybdenum cofactor biosynthesis enzyme MoaA